MAKLIDLDPLVPDDIEFRYQGESYFVRGDITVERALRLLKLLGDLDEPAPPHDAPKKDLDEYEDRQGKSLLALEQELLDLFQERQPELEELPVGIRGVAEVTIALLTALGVVQEKAVEPDPSRPAARRGTPAGARKKSPRSSGSRR